MQIVWVAGIGEILQESVVRQSTVECWCSDGHLSFGNWGVTRVVIHDWCQAVYSREDFSDYNLSWKELKASWKQNFWQSWRCAGFDGYGIGRHWFHSTYLSAPNFVLTNFRIALWITARIRKLIWLKQSAYLYSLCRLLYRLVCGRPDLFRFQNSRKYGFCLPSRYHWTQRSFNTEPSPSTAVIPINHASAQKQCRWALPNSIGCSG